MEGLLLRRLETMAQRVRGGIETCADYTDIVRSGNSLEPTQEVQLGLLRFAAQKLEKEIQNVLRDKPAEVTEEFSQKLNYHTELQLVAEELLVEIDVISQSAKKVEIAASTSTHAETSRLPQLEIPRFDGDKLKWTGFWDRFSASIGSKRLANVDKLAYLVNAMEGPAKETLQGMHMTNENYALAVQKLHERFGKPEAVIDAHYSALYRIPPASSNTVETCRKVWVEIEGHLRALELMGQKVNDNEGLRTTIMEKFPSELNYEVRKSLEKNGYTVRNIRTALEKTISDREDSIGQSKCATAPLPLPESFTTETLTTAVTGSSVSETSVNKKKDRHRHRDTSSHGSKQTSTGNHAKPSQNHARNGRRPPKSNESGPPQKRRKVECTFCKGPHFNDACNKFPNADVRKQQVLGRCFQCFRSHMSKDCWDKRKCYHCGAFGKHNRSLCPKKFGNGDSAQASNVLVSDTRQDTILPTALVHIAGQPQCGDLPRLLLDTGSQRSYVTTQLANKLKLQEIGSNDLTVYTFGNMTPKRIQTTIVLLPLRLSDKVTLEVLAYTVPRITGPLPANLVVRKKISQIYSNLNIAPDTEADRPVDILIGSDFCYSFLSGESKQVQANLYLLQSKLGWIVSGRPNEHFLEQTLSFLTYVEGSRGKEQFVLPDPPLLGDDRVKELWDLEAIGIKDSPKMIQQDEIVEFFKKTTTMENGRYYVKWPWVQYPTDLPQNYGLALGRLTGLVKRLEPKILEQYDSVIQDQLSKGVIELLDMSQPEQTPPLHPIHYLPHHCVVQEGKTTKLRIVYDASARVKGTCSLNDYLYKGPCMLEDIVTLLLRFRQCPVALTADVEKAFLQVGLQLEDRDVTRFLWMKEISKGVRSDNLMHLRFCRVPFGVVSSPYLLAATIRHHLSRHSSPEATLISDNLYVDNLVCSVNTIEEAQQVYNTARQLFGELSMNIREWNSSSRAFMEQIPVEQQSKESNPSVLGLTWDTNSDSLSIAYKPSMSRSVSTKRETLRTIASVFDPLGFVSPFTLSAKLLHQSLWRDKYKWDETLPETVLTAWENCMTSLRAIPKFSIPRVYTSSSLKGGNVTDIQLHCFTDASQDAYAAVTYLRVCDPQTTTVSFIMSRSRLTPLKQRELMTTPKLELLGVLIGTRLVKYLQEVLAIPTLKVYLWTDSQVVLGWINSEQLLPPFVARRVSEIKAANLITFCYVTSQYNPADIATRLLTAENLPALWTDGPPFLRLPAEQWPPQADCSVHQTALDATNQNITDEITDNPTLSANSLLVVRESATAAFPVASDSQQVDQIKQLQQEHFPREVSGVQTDLFKSLRLFTDDHGLLRCNGKLQNADLPHDQKFPILLPKNVDFTRDTIKKIHTDNHHVGVSHTLALIRKQFWIPQGRSQVAAVLRTCQRCVKYGGGPYRLPPMPSLPQERVSTCPPFSYTGLDYLGPLTVKQGGQSHKRWCVLFTCMAVRAVHLEIVEDMSADAFLLSLRRFVAARGLPVVILSDNALQFKLTADVIKSTYCTSNNIQWRFITELAPWQGGFYERLVGLVKHCLRRSLDKILLTDAQLQTVIKEVETVLNTRPLTAVGQELEHVLTPADFLHPVAPVTVEGPPPASGSVTVTKAALIDGWKRGQKAFEEFRAMFCDQYLSSLNERPFRPHRQPRVVAHHSPAVGDVVQVKREHHSRAHWQVGRISALIPGCDGNIRTARVLLPNGTELTRSVSHLYPLEICDPDSDGTVTPPILPAAVSPNPPMLSVAPAPQPPPADSGPTVLPLDSANPPRQPPMQTVNPARSDGRPRRQANILALDRLRQWTRSLVALSPASST